MKILASFIALSLFIGGCYMNKTLDKTVVVYVDDSTIRVDKQQDGSTKYINNYNTDDYKNKFIAELKSEFTNCNIALTDIPSKADYSLILDELIIKEYSTEETVSDESSEYNGMTYVLSNCDIVFNGRLLLGEPGKNAHIDKIYATADKEEKVTNNRSLGDYIAGSNKDNSSYRQKSLNDDIFITLSEKCGRRTTASLSKRIFRHLKKGK